MKDITQNIEKNISPSELKRKDEFKKYINDNLSVLGKPIAPASANAVYDLVSKYETINWQDEKGIEEMAFEEAELCYELMKITLKTFGMSGEENQLKEIFDQFDQSMPGETLLFPEFAAYTKEGSQNAFQILSQIALTKKISIITTLNHHGVDLPGADLKTNYNVLFIFSRNGEIHSPQAKITPQSFEMKHLDPHSPKINVAPYSRLNRVTLRQNGKSYKVYFFICSDLYTLKLFDGHTLESDAILCPANFGNGAEGSAENLIHYTVHSKIFRQGFFCNTYQKVKDGLVPLTIKAVQSFDQNQNPVPHDKSELIQNVITSCTIYPDEQYWNFQSMLKLTQNGTFTVPRSRSQGNGLKVDIGEYKTVIDL